ncbi:hypothetical protein ACOSP7_013168 [Xanthoceras sorbifolium]|uniref:Exostosin GT47 domain-containing protein n=1 Tax=Xanthoceras sorbifolium TaxID=99658 RepID=A0ABQ8HZ53_9ROSI|nr:hypothetical protein JRO89_XS06G0225700 [Xanthoceras sorbifolium]
MKKKQSKKPLSKRKILTALTVLAFLFTLLAFFKDHEKHHKHFPAKTPVLKVYMYDLPAEFNYDVIEHFYKARGHRVTVPLEYPSHQHSSEWHLFRDLTKPASKRVGSVVTRVSDPEAADMFFVPFLSSLSAIVNKTQWFMPGSDRDLRDVNYNYNNEALQEELVEWLEGQYYWRRNRGWDHVFVAQNPNAMARVMDRIRKGVLLVSDPRRASLIKDVLIPYSHRITAYDGPVGVDNRKTLLFFRGNRFQKGEGEVRDMLFRVLENEDDVIIRHGSFSKETQLVASQGMHSSKFCLHPAGTTPASCRLFDAIVSMCIPVVVSDNIELPFEDVIDYRKISIFVNSTSAVKPGFLVSLLRDIPTERVLEYQHELKSVRQYFDYDEDPDGPVSEIWHQVSQKLPLIKLMINREKRIVQRDWNKPDCSCLCSNAASSTISSYNGAIN